MSVEINYAVFKKAFAMPQAVADSCKLANECALRCVLYIFAHQEEGVDAAGLSSSLHLPLEDVEEAILFWQSTGILKGGDPLPERIAPPAVPVSASGVFSSHPQKPTRGEIAARLSEDERLGFMIRQAEIYLGRTLTVVDAGTLIALHDWAGLDPNVVVTIIAYCCSKKTTGIQKIQKEALSWADAGITTCEAAEVYIRKLEAQDRACNTVKSLLGLAPDRNLTASEESYAVDWLCEMEIPHELMEEAARRCREKQGMVRFSAVNKLVSSWHGKGIASLKELQKGEATSISDQKKKYRGFTSSTPSFSKEDLTVDTAVPIYKRRDGK